MRKAVRHNGLPDKVTIDKSGANTAALEALKEETGQSIERMHMIKKGQMVSAHGRELSAAEKFYSLAS